MKIGNNNWLESINDGEQVNIIVRGVDTNRNGNYYLQALREEDSKFFMVNIGETQATELEGASYAVMICSGHGVNGYPYLTFNVVDDFDSPVDRWKQTQLIEEEQEEENIVYKATTTVDDEQTGSDVYSLDEMEDDLREINRRIRVAVYEFDPHYDCIRKVQDDVVDALALIYKNKLKTEDMQ